MRSADIFRVEAKRNPQTTPARRSDDAPEPLAGSGEHHVTVDCANAPVTFVRACLPIVLVLAAACASDSSVPPQLPLITTPNSVRLVSDPGDVIGNGGSYDYSPANALLTVNPFRNEISIRVVGDSVWDAYLVIPGGVKLRAGTFTDLPGYPSTTAAGGAFRWASQERQCAPSNSAVTIERAEYDGDALLAIDLRFEQRCGALSAALRGTVHWQAGDRVGPSGPVVPVPASLWQPPVGSTPVKVSYVYLDMDASFAPGASFPRTIVPAPSVVPVSVTGRNVSVTAEDTVAKLAMNGRFQLLLGQTEIKVGYYHDLRGNSATAAPAGALDVTLNARGCATHVGWFAVDHVFYFNGLLTQIDLRFEERCSDFSAPMRGQIHWRESP